MSKCSVCTEKMGFGSVSIKGGYRVCWKCQQFYEECSHREDYKDLNQISPDEMKQIIDDEEAKFRAGTSESPKMNNSQLNTSCAVCSKSDNLVKLVRLKGGRRICKNCFRMYNDESKSAINSKTSIEHIRQTISDEYGNLKPIPKEEWAKTKKKANKENTIWLIVAAIVVFAVFKMCSNYERVLSPEELKKEKQEKIERQFNAWDGGHINLELLIRDRMVEPSSYRHISSRYREREDYIVVTTVFSIRNRYGYRVQAEVIAHYDLDGKLIKIIKDIN